MREEGEESEEGGRGRGGVNVPAKGRPSVARRRDPAPPAGSVSSRKERVSAIAASTFRKGGTVSPGAH